MRPTYSTVNLGFHINKVDIVRNTMFGLCVNYVSSLPLQCYVATALASFSLLYWSSAAFRFHLRMVLYCGYFILAAACLIPIMLCNGRSRKNIKWCAYAQRLSGKLFGLHSEVRNVHNLVTDGPSVIVSNHQSALDVTGMGKLFSPRSTILAKKELMYAGPFGLGIWLSGFVFVQRSCRKNSTEVLAKVANEINKDGLCVWIFPEGTRNTKNEMLQFKKGAFNLAVEAQVPIVPVVFSSYKKFFDPEAYVFGGGNYVIDVLPPISTKNLTRADVPKLADDVRESMMQVFKKISGECE